MVTITETGFSVIIETGCHPAEQYVNSVNGIVDSLQMQSKDFTDNNFHLLELLKNMLPTFDQAKTMLELSEMLSKEAE